MSPVAFLIFNRPDCTARTFAAIREARPPRLLVVADGPRANRPGEDVKCRETRRIIDEGVDWPCEVERNYSPVNLGCAERVAGGLDWAFSRADWLIVVEDDCLPDPSFFRFCDQLLERYADDQRIGQICGSPFICDQLDRPTSYIFSRYGPIWGWASWARAWKYYSLTLESWPEVERSGNFRSFIPDPFERRSRRKTYNGLHHGPRSTWDLQWGYAKMANSMLSIIPTRSMIENIGFGADATHTFTQNGPALTRGRMPDTLVHPTNILADAAFNDLFSNKAQLHLWQKRLSALSVRFNIWAGSDPR
jgi:hypothetical protein